MAFENVTEFDKWALCFQYQQRLIQDSIRGQLDNSMMDNVNLLGHNNSFGPGSLSPLKGNMASMIDDNKSLNNSMMRRGPRAVGMKFSTSFTTEGDIIAAKER